MGKKIQYKIVGRYMSGKEVTGYHMISNTGKSEKYSREQVAFLVGKEQVINCEGQIYKDKLLLRGVGIQLDSLPVKQDDSAQSKTTEGSKSIEQQRQQMQQATQIQQRQSINRNRPELTITGMLINGRNTLGYVVSDMSGETRNIPRNEVLQLARDGVISNARVQQYNGQFILKGVNCDFRQLPKYKCDTNGNIVDDTTVSSIAVVPETRASKSKGNNIKNVVSGFDYYANRISEIGKLVNANIHSATNYIQAEWEYGHITFRVREDGAFTIMYYIPVYGFKSKSVKKLGNLRADRKELEQELDKINKQIMANQMMSNGLSDKVFNSNIVD